MKLKVLSIILLFTFAACEVVELDSPSVGPNGISNEQIAVTGIQVADSNQAILVIADSVSKNWEAADFTLGGSDNLTSCRLDDKMVFFKNGIYNYTAGERCGAEDNRSSRDGTWRIEFAKAKMIFDEGTSDEYEAEIIGLKENELRLKGNYFNLEVRGLYTAN